MDRLVRRITGRGAKTSEAASLFGNIFQENDVEDEFYNSLVSHFVNFDESNPYQENKLFSTDIEYIVQCTMDDLTSYKNSKKKVSRRIDSYFYIYRRIEQYINIPKQGYSLLYQLREKLFEVLTLIFKDTKGEQPNICIKDRILLKELNIFQHLSSIASIKTPEKVHTFFVLFKLSIQSSIIIDGYQNQLKWKDTLLKVQEINLSLEDFIDQYIIYEHAFRQCPLDMPAFIYLIQKMPPSKQSRNSPFITFFQLSKKLHFNDITFFKDFQHVFDNGLKVQPYDMQHISELLVMLSKHDQLFYEYLTIYSSSVNNTILWKMYLSLSKISDLNIIMRKHLSTILSKRISTEPTEAFQQYMKSAKEYLKQIEMRTRPYFIEIFEQIYDSYVMKEIQDKGYPARLNKKNLEGLLKIDSSLIPTNHMNRPSNLLIIQQLLFKIDPTILNTVEKIKRLFQNINDFDVSICKNNNPVNIIKDEWLNDFIIIIPQVWMKLDLDVYKYLCNSHQNNQWTIYIWSRIVHLSLLRTVKDNPNPTLLKLNEWMKIVKHDVYNSNDILTIIFIKNLFEVIIVKYMKSVILLPNIETIIKFVISIKERPPNGIDAQQLADFIRNGSQELEHILQLTGTRSMYCELLNGSIIRCFLPYIDLKKILPSTNTHQYRFPMTTPKIDAIVSLPKPRDIDITNKNSKEEFFDRFIQDINEWFPWFDKFISIFQHIIEWLKTYNVNRTNQLSLDLNRIKDDPKVTLSQLRIIVENITKVLLQFNDLRRLCQLFNCLTSFEIIDEGTLNIQESVMNYIKELKRFQPNNTFTVENGILYEHKIPINDRQNVRWSLVNENHPCNIKIEYRTDELNNPSRLIYEKNNSPINRNVLSGQFQTERSGQLIITINNRQNHISHTLWYRIRSVNLSTCHLFHGILNMIYKKYFNQSNQIIPEKEFSRLLDDAFVFINNLLNGHLTLKEMADLRTVFYDKNIHIREEVEKLLTSRSAEQITNNQDIEQVCEWLQIYQYYSHISVIMECMAKFDILSNDSDDESIGHLQRLGADENCTLRDITQAYRILQQRFQNLTHQHLQLIKTAVECSNVIYMMKKADLYSNHGRRRFQELRDNLTTQFQLQEKNNIILNSWIITYALIEPFMYKVKKFDEFLVRIAHLSNLEESSLNHIKTVSDNIQIVNMWLSAEDTTVLDNALITMEHLYKSGAVDIRLRHLMNEQSYFEIGYFIDRTQGQNDDKQEAERIKFVLSMTDIDDHKRQLTFCNVDIQQNKIHNKSLINGQLKLLQTIEKIYLALKKLEMAGHPDYQLREERYDIHLQHGRPDAALGEFRINQNARLEQDAKTRTDNLEFVYRRLNDTYNKWIENLEKSREEYFLLKLFSNRQIMILIILLRTSGIQNSIRNRFLQKLFSFKNLQNQNDEEQKLTILCLKHYLSSLKIQQSDLSYDNISQVYEKYQIESGSNTEICLKKLCTFLQDLFNNGNELIEKRIMIDENQQYLVTLKQRSTETSSLDYDLDTNTFCILLNIFNNRLPSSYQILWCSIATTEDIKLFFSRIRTFRYLIFVIMDIDKMHHRLREFLLNEQDLLTRGKEPHGIVYYFSKELTTSRNGLREFHIPAQYRNPNHTYKQLTTLFQKQKSVLPQIQIIYGAAGIGKTHRINTQYKNDNISCFSINDNLNLSSLISSFLVFDSKMINNDPLIYFNISVHAPFEELNRTLFSLFICGSLMDIHNGLIFSLPIGKPWKFIVEVPYSEMSGLAIKENFNQILPLLSIISPSSLEEVTSDNYQLYIGEEEELVARFLKAYENRTIDRLAVTAKDGTDRPVEFDRITNSEECRCYIYNCMINYAPELPRNKIYELSFTKFLYRRIRFFIGHFFCWNQSINQLGSTAMKQMINEAKSLTKINFKDNDDPCRVYLVYDPGFSLHLLHNDWNGVSYDLKKLFGDQDPSTSIEYRHKDYLVECLAWLIDIPYESFSEIMNEKKFILTENFAYKLFHVHERKLTKLALIIEGDTGVGKTFLLKFYSSLLNAKNTRDQSENSVIPRIIENTSLWLRTILSNMVENQPVLLNTFVQQIKRKLLGLDDNNDDDENNLNQPPPPAEQHDVEFFNEIKLSLQNLKYNEEILFYMWKTILTISSENNMENTPIFIQELHDFVTSQLVNYPLIEPSIQLMNLLQITISPTIQLSIGIFKEYLFHSQIKPLFYRLLLHPGITEEQVVEFMNPITQLARELTNIELVVFFDEVNTSSCLGLFKEMFMDGTLHGMTIPKNIFFTAAINPFMKIEDTNKVHRNDFIVHQLPQSLENLTVSYGTLEARTLADYILKKIAMFQVSSSASGGQPMPLDSYVQETLAECILRAQDFCEKRLGRNSVSQREIQRCFTLIEFFWRLRYDHEIEHGHSSDPNPIRCIALSLALIYYFRLPTKEDNSQRKDDQTPSREELAEILSQSIPDFDELIQNELQTFVNTDNFIIPPGVAINQAVREHIFSIVVSIVTRTPLCIIGVPGQSKTLSFQIVLQNLQGSQLSPKPFCKRLPAIDPFFCLGSKYSRSEDIAYIFDRAIKREQQYEQNRMDTRCVVFLDEASLPDEKKMVLKVLHPYLDECKVAFVAIANKAFDAANANRMICIYRSLPSEDDQKILAYGCLGLQLDHNQLENLIYGLCQGYRQILHSPEIPHIFHDRDFIYTLRELRFELTNINEEQESSIGEITPRSLLRALEDNFNGIKQNEFEELVQIFFQSMEKYSPGFHLRTERQQQQQEKLYRDVPTILRESMKLDSKRRRLYGRYKLIIDESDDESAVHLLFQSGILDPDTNRTTVFRMSDFPDDTDNELRNVEILSTIKLCMETGKTILMVNTGRIHGSLYDVFNQNFSIMATDDSRKIFSKVAIGPKTMDVVVHEDFQCIVHIKRKEFNDIPAPFLSRFQKYSLSVTDFYSIHLKQLPTNEQILMKNVEEKVSSFIQHFGKQYFYGLNDSTLYSCLLILIKKDENGEYFLSNILRNYSQLTIKSKSFIEQDSTDIRQCLLYSIISKLLQLVSPESMIYRLPTFDDKIARLLCNNYFYHQEHFNIENLIHRMISSSSIDIDALSIEDMPEQKRNDITITTKVMIYTRTSAFVTGLNQQTKTDLLNDHENIDILNLAVIENSVALQEQFHNYQQDNDKQVLIIIVDGRIGQQRLHIPFIRQLIDKTENSSNLPNEIPQKFFIILVHSTGQEHDHKLYFPSIFLHDWDYYFLDTGTAGSAFHLQRMLQIFTSSLKTHEDEKEESVGNDLCNLNMLFNECLWDFCSRIQIILQDLPSNMFKNNLVYEFYQRETSTRRRVECLKEILRQSQQLQKRIVSTYHENISMNKKSFHDTCNSIYQISKDILCGKRSNSLVDSFQSQIRIKFTNFVSNILKFIVNDYGLETLFKLSNGYESLLNLIDYSSFSVNDDIENNPQSFSANQGILQLTNHYSCIPQTPLYHLFHQRIRTSANEIKLILHLKTNEYQEEKDDDKFHQDYNRAPTTTMAFNNQYNDNQETEHTSQQFRNRLIESLMNDKILTEIISESILESYINDTVRTLCTIVEKSFNNNLDQCQKTIEFVSRWLLLTDENDDESLSMSSNKDIWRLAHVYTFFEYDQNDLYSLYSACRITDQLDPTQSFYDNLFHHNHITRSTLRENLFQLMFDYLWQNLRHLCSTNDTTEQWIHSYTFISKYYPSDKVLQHMQLIHVKGQIEFMNLVYLIFLNEKLPESKELVLQLLKDTSLLHDDVDGRNINFETSLCLKLLPVILNTIHKYLENQNLQNSTLMIDIQQWIISTLKSSNQSCEQEIKYLYKFLDQPTCPLSLSMKQFLFDELTNMLFKLRRQNRPGAHKQNMDFRAGWKSRDQLFSNFGSLLLIVCL